VDQPRLALIGLAPQVADAGLDDVADAAKSGGLLLVGHNRRFAPLARTLHERVRPPVLVQMRVAAGPLPAGHWLEDPEHGGRVLGEISHFVDLAAFLCGGPPSGATAHNVDGSLLCLLRFANGSVASIAYSVGASGKLPKERIEVLGAAATGVIDDFERLEIFGAGSMTATSKRDKGHREQLRSFVDAALGRAEPPVPVDEQLAVAEISLELVGR